MSVNRNISNIIQRRIANPPQRVRRDGSRFPYRLGLAQGATAVLKQLLIVPDKNGDVCCAY